MIGMRRGGWVAATVAAAFWVGGANAQTTPADPFAPGAAAETTPDAAPSAGKASKSAPRPRKAKPHRAEAGGLTVVVDNKRSVGLVDLEVGPAGDANPTKVAGPLAFGRKTTIHLKRAKDCLYDVRGHFADGADTEHLGVELCKDKTINLTDE